MHVCVWAWFTCNIHFFFLFYSVRSQRSDGQIFVARGAIHPWNTDARLHTINASFCNATSNSSTLHRIRSTCVVRIHRMAIYNFSEAKTHQQWKIDARNFFSCFNDVPTAALNRKIWDSPHHIEFYGKYYHSKHMNRWLKFTIPHANLMRKFPIILVFHKPSDHFKHCDFLYSPHDFVERIILCFTYTCYHIQPI